MKARQKWDLLILNSEVFENILLPNSRNLNPKESSKKHIFDMKECIQFFNKIIIFYYFCSLRCSKSCSFDAVFHAISNECILEHLSEKK